MKTDYEYIRFVQLPTPGRKTSVWSCRSVRIPAVELGRIIWYGSWRQYCYAPCQQTVYSEGCLADIMYFIAQLMQARKMDSADCGAAVIR